MTTPGLPPLFGAPWERGGGNDTDAVERAFHATAEAFDAYTSKVRDLLKAVEDSNAFTRHPNAKARARELVNNMGLLRNWPEEPMGRFTRLLAEVRAAERQR